MTQRENQRQFIAHYLLGELSEDEQSDFEVRYFADDQLFADLLRVEAEMIDCYARDRLDASERRRFETHFLQSAERQQRVEEIRRNIADDKTCPE